GRHDRRGASRVPGHRPSPSRDRLRRAAGRRPGRDDPTRPLRRGRDRNTDRSEADHLLQQARGPRPLRPPRAGAAGPAGGARAVHDPGEGAGGGTRAMNPSTKDLVSLHDLTSGEIEEILDLAGRVKGNPGHYSDALAGQTLAMLFEKPSLRTRVTFEAGM